MAFSTLLSEEPRFFTMLKSHLRTILLWLYCHNIIPASTTAKAIKLFKLEAGDE